jgi:hypothetical protein
VTDQTALADQMPILRYVQRALTDGYDVRLTSDFPGHVRMSIHRRDQSKGCDTCGGTGEIYEQGEPTGVHGGNVPCPDCRAVRDRLDTPNAATITIATDPDGQSLEVHLGAEVLVRTDYDAVGWAGLDAMQAAAERAIVTTTGGTGQAMTVLALVAELERTREQLRMLTRQRDLLRRGHLTTRVNEIQAAIGDPGSVVPRRGGAETIPSWCARAVVAVLGGQPAPEPPAGQEPPEPAREQPGAEVERLRLLLDQAQEYARDLQDYPDTNPAYVLNVASHDGYLYLECGECDDHVTGIEPGYALTDLLAAARKHHATYHAEVTADA